MWGWNFGWEMPLNIFPILSEFLFSMRESEFSHFDGGIPGTGPFATHLDFFDGSDLPREISVDPMHPMFSLGADIWCKDESTASRLMACPHMMLSHSELGNPRGTVLEFWIHCLMALKSWVNKVRVLCDSSHFLFPVHLSSSSWENHGIWDSKILSFLLDCPLSTSESLASLLVPMKSPEKGLLGFLDSRLICDMSSLMSVLHCASPRCETPVPCSPVGCSPR